MPEEGNWWLKPVSLLIYGGSRARDGVDQGIPVYRANVPSPWDMAGVIRFCCALFRLLV